MSRTCNGRAPDAGICFDRVLSVSHSAACGGPRGNSITQLVNQLPRGGGARLARRACCTQGSVTRPDLYGLHAYAWRGMLASWKRLDAVVRAEACWTPANWRTERRVGCESSCRVKHYVQLLEHTVGPQHHRSGYMSPRAVELWCALLWLCCGWIGASVRRRRVSRVR